MKWFDRIFRRRDAEPPKPLRTEGVGEAPMTPEPDDAELAAQALLESMAERRPALWRLLRRRHGKDEKDSTGEEPGHGALQYYKGLAERIRVAHLASNLRMRRFLAYCEQQLQKPSLPLSGAGSLTLLETELYKRIDLADREGGEIKRRWQHCLADVTVRIMETNQQLGDEEPETETAAV